MIPSQIAYTGSALEPAVAVYDGSIRLTAGTDYTVAYSGNTEKGTAIATVTGHGNYIGAPTASFTISSNTGSLTVTMRPDGSAVYDGGNHKPALEVKSGTNDATYAAVYTYNGTDMGAFGADTQFVDAGTYVITVTGTGSYEGAAGRVVFVVRPAAFTVGAVADQNYDGTPKTPKPMVKNNSGADLTEGIDYLLSYTNNVARGTATITVIGQGNYAGYSSSVTFSITGSSTVFGITYDGNGSTGGTVPVDSKEYLIGGQATVPQRYAHRAQRGISGLGSGCQAVCGGWQPGGAGRLSRALPGRRQLHRHCKYHALRPVGQGRRQQQQAGLCRDPCDYSLRWFRRLHHPRQNDQLSLGRPERGLHHPG